MVKNFEGTVGSQPLYRLPLYHLIDEICCFGAPAKRYLIWLDLDLLIQNCVSDFLSASAVVGPLAKHALVGYDAYCVKVNSYAVILLAHHFWSHVTWRTARFL